MRQTNPSPNRMLATTVGALGVAILLTAGCGGADNGDTQQDDLAGTIYASTDPVVADTQDKYPAIELEPAEICAQPSTADDCAYVFNAGAVGQKTSTTISIRNPGERSLRVKTVTIKPLGSAAGPSPFELSFAQSPAFQKKLDDGLDYYWVAPMGQATSEVPESLNITVSFTTPADKQTHSAMLAINTDASNNPNVNVELSSAAATATLKASPEILDFGQVGHGGSLSKNVLLANTGADDLTISGFKLIGSPYFSVIIEGQTLAPEAMLNKKALLDDSVHISQGDTPQMKVMFEPQVANPAKASLLIYSNDKKHPTGKSIELIGNDKLPCIDIEPFEIDFGNQLLDKPEPKALTITSCNDNPLELTGIGLAAGASPDFAPDLSKLEHGPTAEDPVILSHGESAVVDVHYVPDSENPLDANGLPIPDLGTMEISGNFFTGLKQVEMKGFGVETECPTAVIECEEGAEVIPQTKLHLSGEDSHALVGSVVKWNWDVAAPEGAQSAFLPSSDSKKVTYEVNAAGSYLFYLTVYDDIGTPSCHPGVSEVVVVPDEAIHVELLWVTPGDEDETDTGPGMGSDLDLHFAHPWAEGEDIDGDGEADGWFDKSYDCYWKNKYPNWGSTDSWVKDDPTLDRDDTDGAGPENVNLANPQDVVYRVGVYYYDDNGYGGASATVRVFLNSVQAFEQQDVELEMLDFWEVCEVDWTTGEVNPTDLDGKPKIVQGFVPKN